MYQLGKHLVAPHFLLLVLLGLLLIHLWYRRREARSRLLALTVIYLAFLVVSFPPVASLARSSLESQYPPLEQRPADAQAIVVLEGGVGDSVLRCELAAKLYRQGSPCPVLVSSCPDVGSHSYVQAMREHLLLMGVPAPDLIEDTSAQNTYENALRSQALLEPRGIRRIVLVTDAMHMPRSVACFRKQGFEVVPAGCDYERAGDGSPTVIDLLPSAYALRRLEYASQEWLGLVWYRLRGRI
jgi:uncharacterized SAM-binding protein YcdF (DUF218 family)